MSVDHTFFINIIPGLESVAHLELCSRWERAPDFFSLPDYPEIKKFRGGLEFKAPLLWGLELNRHLRSNTRMMLRLGSFSAANQKEMMAGLEAINWAQFIESKSQFDFSFTSKSSRLSMNKQIRELLEKSLKPLKAKFAKGGTKIFVRIFRDQCEISLDCTGEAAFKRGAKGSIASLRNSTASGLLQALLQGVEQDYELIDPMCGAGTLALEAININRLLDRSFSFENFPCYKQTEKPVIETRDRSYLSWSHCNDQSAKAISVAKKNLRDVQNTNFSQNNVFDDYQWEPQDENRLRILVVNPPWGKRLAGAQGDVLQSLYKKYRPDRIGFLMPAHWRLSEIPLTKVRDLHIENSGVKNRFLIYA